MVHIGSGAVINGDLTGNEDVMFEGTLTGEFIASEATLTIGKTGQVDAALRAPRVVVMGTVNGTITGRERIELQATAVVKGDLSAPLVVIAEGATLAGRVDMGKRTITARVEQYKAAHAS
jgi:cytoskeletal protein CcmA (bactofilin family)